METTTPGWLDSLALPAHAAILRRLLTEAAADTRFRFVELSCSVARGAGDELSDLDLALGIDDGAWPTALDAVPPLLARLGGLVDQLDHRIAAWGDVRHRRFFAQYRNGVQIDLVALPASERRGMPAGDVALFDPDGRLERALVPSVQRASGADVREWAFLGWVALLDLDKYLRRGSPWEALERLHEARTQAWRLWAASRAVPYPLFGVTSVLDAPAAGLPPGIERTVAGLDAAEIRTAALAVADVLDLAGAAAADATATTTPEAIAEYARSRLGATAG